jgi:hypothetical protein
VDLGDMATTAGVVVSLTAAWFASRQAKHAGKQANEASQAREAAEKQANAAEEQVNEARTANELTRQQLDAQVADRAERNAPQFHITWLLSSDFIPDIQEFRLEFTGGPNQLDSVAVAPARGGKLVGLYDDHSEQLYLRVG